MPPDFNVASIAGLCGYRIDFANKAALHEFKGSRWNQPYVQAVSAAGERPALAAELFRSGSSELFGVLEFTEQLRQELC